MLGLQRAVVLVHDQLHEVAHERLVAVAVGLLAERGSEHEVQVARGRVARDSRQEPVLPEQRAHLRGGLGDALRAHADVLDHQRGAPRPDLAEQPVQSLAHAPVDLGQLGVARELRRLHDRAAVEDLHRLGLARRQLLGIVGAELDQDRGRVVGRVVPLRRNRRERLRRLHREDHHQLRRACARLHQRLHARDRLVDAGEEHERGRRVPAERHRVEHGLGHERKGSLRADDQPAEDLQRRVGLEERDQPVAHRVLDLELPPDALAPARRPRGSRRGSPAGRAPAPAPARRTAPRRPGAPCRSPSPTAARTSASAPCGRSRAATPHRMPPELLAITPPTVAMSVDAGSGPRRRPCSARSAFTWPSSVPGSTRTRVTVVLDLHAAPVAAHVDHHAVALRLAVEARARGPERDRHSRAAPVGHHLHDVVDVVRHHDRLRDQPVGARVGGVAHEIGDAGEHAVGAEQRRPGRSAAARACRRQANRARGPRPGRRLRARCA